MVLLEDGTLLQININEYIVSSLPLQPATYPNTISLSSPFTSLLWLQTYIASGTTSKARFNGLVVLPAPVETTLVAPSIYSAVTDNESILRYL